jgi:hypothetical protein
MFQAQNLDNFWHWNPLAWHRLLAEQKSGELCPKKLRNSSAFRWIPDLVTGDSGNVTADSGNSPEIGHDKTESAVTIARNERSRSNGISGHVRPEYAQEVAPEV